MALPVSRDKTLKELRERQRARAKRAALRALRKVRAAAGECGADLSAWETEFLGSVEERVETYGRAFRDLQKGAPGASLSNRQAVKVKEIAAKARGKPRIP
ncbi:MAG TPA: hypothetical protein VF835_05445 [Rhizomicrobium sp.]